jgi:DNA-binding MarR family transcriptional regulator
MTNEIEALLNEVRLLYNRIVQTGEQLHTSEEVTLGMRAVLEYLQWNGATPVPEIARRRLVTRQHIQSLVNDLLDQRLVVLEKNPLHKRSSLVALTKAGERVIRRMRKRENRLYESTKFRVKRSDLELATDVLKRVRDALQETENQL